MSEDRLDRIPESVDDDQSVSEFVSQHRPLDPQDTSMHRAGHQHSGSQDSLIFGFYQDSIPKCAFCQEPIHEKPTKLLGRYWHKEHSKCLSCSRPMGIDNFAEIDGKLYCEDHYRMIRGTPIIYEVVLIDVVEF